MSCAICGRRHKGPRCQQKDLDAIDKANRAAWAEEDNESDIPELSCEERLSTGFSLMTNDVYEFTTAQQEPDDV